MGDVQTASTTIKDGLKGLQGAAGEEVQQSLKTINAATDAINDVAGKLSGALRGCLLRAACMHGGLLAGAFCSFMAADASPSWPGRR